MDEQAEQLARASGRAIVEDRQTGRKFVTPYRYERQFEADFDEASHRMIRKHGSPTERFALALASILGSLLGVSMQGLLYGLRLLVADLAIAAALTFVIIVAMVGTISFCIWWGLRGRLRFRTRLIEERLCFECGYALIGQDVDEHGVGRCPECGETFNVTRYLRPPKRYHRLTPH